MFGAALEVDKLVAVGLLSLFQWCRTVVGDWRLCKCRLRLGEVSVGTRAEGKGNMNINKIGYFYLW